VLDFILRPTGLRFSSTLIDSGSAQVTRQCGAARLSPPRSSSPPTQPNIAHLFYSNVQEGLLVVLDNGDGKSVLARFSPPSPTFKPIFSLNLTNGEQDEGLYDVSPDGSKLLSVLVDSSGLNPVLSIVDLTLLKEVGRIPIKGFNNGDSLVDVNWCNVA
jgi:hypothetical protein